MHSNVRGVVVLLGLVIGSSGARAAPGGQNQLVALPSLPGTTANEAWAVNDSGTVVGWGGNYETDNGEDFYAVSTPTRWTCRGGGCARDGSAWTVEALDGPLLVLAADGSWRETAYVSGTAVDINASGTIAGNFMRSKFGGSIAAAWDETDRVWRSLPLPAGVFGSQARGINNRGDIVGRTPPGRATVWRDGGVEQLPVVGDFCSAFAVNDSGDVTGWCELYLDEESVLSYAARWEDGVPTLLHGEGIQAYGRDINNSGLVVGLDAVAPDGHGTAVAWDPRDHGGLTEVAELGVANGVNEPGAVAGYVGANGGASKAAVWSRIDGDPVLYEPLEGGTYTWFRGINNSGLAVGFSEIQGGNVVATFARR